MRLLRLLPVFTAGADGPSGLAHPPAACLPPSLPSPPPAPQLYGSGGTDQFRKKAIGGIIFTLLKLQRPLDSASVGARCPAGTPDVPPAGRGLVCLVAPTDRQPLPPPLLCPPQDVDSLGLPPKGTEKVDPAAPAVPVVPAVPGLLTLCSATHRSTAPSFSRCCFPQLKTILASADGVHPRVAAWRQDERRQVVDSLEQIWGVGHATATKWCAVGGEDLLLGSSSSCTAAQCIDHRSFPLSPEAGTTRAAGAWRTRRSATT